MSFRATLTCSKGHTQTLTYGDGFSREMAEDHCTLMFGGHLHSLDRDWKAMGGCAWSENGASPCGGVVSWVMEAITQ